MSAEAWMRVFDKDAYEEWLLGDHDSGLGTTLFEDLFEARKARINHIMEENAEALERLAEGPGELPDCCGRGSARCTCGC